MSTPSSKSVIYDTLVSRSRYVGDSIHPLCSENTQQVVFLS